VVRRRDHPRRLRADRPRHRPHPAGAAAVRTPAAEPEASTLAARDALATAHLDLVDLVAGHLIRRSRLPAHVERAELVAAGSLGLMRAAERFDPTRNDNFRAWARSFIRGAMLDDLRNASMLKRRGLERLKSGEIVHGREDLRAAHEIAVPAQQLEDVERASTAGRLSRLVAKLPTRLQFIIVEHHLRERTFQDIARDMGVTAQRVSQLHRRALLFMRGSAADDLKA
jgi:RNA polymerase sigma factor FliA